MLDTDPEKQQEKTPAEPTGKTPTPPADSSAEADAEEEKSPDDSGLPPQPVKQVVEPVKLAPLTGTLLEAISGSATDAVVSRHIATGEGINDKNDEDKMTPLHYAALYRPLEIIKALVTQGANKSAADVFGDLPLDYLVYSDKLTKAQKAKAWLLLGGDKNDQEYKDMTGTAADIGAEG